jgi:hypothetical protein
MRSIARCVLPVLVGPSTARMRGPEDSTPMREESGCGARSARQMRGAVLKFSCAPPVNNRGNTGGRWCGAGEDSLNWRAASSLNGRGASTRNPWRTRSAQATPSAGYVVPRIGPKRNCVKLNRIRTVSRGHSCVRSGVTELGRKLPIRFGVHSWPKPPPRSVACSAAIGPSSSWNGASRYPNSGRSQPVWQKRDRAHLGRSDRLRSVLKADLAGDPAGDLGCLNRITAIGGQCYPAPNALRWLRRSEGAPKP